MTVYRTRPLPRGALHGRYKISPKLIDDTKQALRTFYEAGRHEGGHEGLCYWAGREAPDVTCLEAVVAPTARHGQYGVFVFGGRVCRRSPPRPSDGPGCSSPKCIATQAATLGIPMATTT